MFWLREHPSHVLPLAVRTNSPAETRERRQDERASRHRKRPGLHFKPRSLSPPPLRKKKKNYDSSVRQMEPPAMGRTSPTLRRAWPKDGPLAAICVQSVDVQCVLQFTLIHAAGCVLHRRTSRVIHRLKLFFSFSLSPSRATPAKLAEACQPAERAFERFSQRKEMRRERVIKFTKGGGRHPHTRTGGTL